MLVKVATAVEFDSDYTLHSGASAHYAFVAVYILINLPKRKKQQKNDIDISRSS